MSKCFKKINLYNSKGGEREREERKKGPPFPHTTPSNLRNFFHIISLLGPRIVTINVQNLRHCHCEGRCTGSQPELRTKACTIDPKRILQYKEQIDISKFHGSVKKASSASTSKHLTFLDFHELLLFPEGVRPRRSCIGEPPAPVSRRQVAVLLGRGALPAVRDGGLERLALRVQERRQERRPREAPRARGVHCVFVRSRAI
jgi:hypothetical protein